MAKRTCSVVGCGRPHKTRDWCGTHYERWRRSGVVGGPEDARRRPAVPCSIDGCETRARTRGWCLMHYGRWKAHKDPTVTLQPNRGTGRALHRDGYVMLWRPEHPMAMSFGYVMEHRYVVYESGILIPDGWHVHHRNHVKDDNRLSNLAVMSPSAHQSHHVTPGSVVKNQYGQWIVGTGVRYRQSLWEAA